MVEESSKQKSNLHREKTNSWLWLHLRPLKCQAIDSEKIPTFCSTGSLKNIMFLLNARKSLKPALQKAGLLGTARLQVCQILGWNFGSKMKKTSGCQTISVALRSFLHLRRHLKSKIIDRFQSKHYVIFTRGDQIYRKARNFALFFA